MKLLQGPGRALKKVGSRALLLRRAASPPATIEPREDVILSGTRSGTKGVDRSRRRRGLQLKVTFVLGVVIPTILGLIYYFMIASPQFESETHFGVRKGSGAQVDVGGSLGFLNSLNSGATVSDSYVVVDFLRSSAFVQELDGEFDLRKIYGAPADALARVSPSASLEDLSAYWRSMTTARVDNHSQAIIFAVRAFDAAAAKRLAEAALAKSEKLVNALSDRSREEALASAREEVKLAEQRLSAQREAIRRYRESSKVLDPTKSLSGRQELAGKLQAEIASRRAELSAMRRSLSENAPSVVAVTTRIASLETELERVRTEIDAGAGAQHTSEIVKEFENLQTDQAFFEKAYVAALTNLDRARVDADRRTKYLAVHVAATQAEAALYPRRAFGSFLTFFAAFVAWGVSWLLFLAVRDHIY